MRIRTELDAFGSMALTNIIHLFSLEFYGLLGYVGIGFGGIWMSLGRFSGSSGGHVAGNPWLP